MRILVVEDEEELAAVIVEALEEERYAVDKALTGDEADELMFINPYDLVIL
ncbi:MAG: response regulator transcription factor [bacterium]|nr:response regulator transcription factor [bacterium]